MSAQLLLLLIVVGTLAQVLANVLTMWGERHFDRRNYTREQERMREWLERENHQLLCAHNAGPDAVAANSIRHSESSKRLLRAEIARLRQRLGRSNIQFVCMCVITITCLVVLLIATNGGAA